MSQITQFSDKVSISYIPGEYKFVVKGATPSTITNDFLLCDGSTVLQSSFPELFSVIGLAFYPSTSTPTLITEYSKPYQSDIPSVVNGVFKDAEIYYVYGDRSSATYGLYSSTNLFLWEIPSYVIDNVNDLIYSGDLFVLCGDSGRIRTSTDGVTWTQRTSGTTSNINTLIYGNALYVYGGVGGVLRTSTDAITWNSRTSGTTSNIEALLYANSLYVYGARGGGLSTSTDGVTWDARTSGTTSSILSVAYGNSLYVYGGQGGVLATSTDAITWTARTSGTGQDIHSVAYGNNLYVAFHTTYSTSTNGITWNTNTRPLPSNLAYGYFDQSAGEFIVVDNNGNIATSTDASNWIIKNGQFKSQLVYQNKHIYAGANGKVILTTDFNTWQEAYNNTNQQIQKIDYLNNLFISVGDSGSLATSTDAVTWDTRTSGTTSSILSLAYGNGLYVYGGVGGVLATSTDAITWTARTSGTTSSILSLAYGNGLYVYGTTGGTIATSTDTITWTARLSAGIGRNINSIDYGAGKFIAGTSYSFSNTERIYGSYDGINWSRIEQVTHDSSVEIVKFIRGSFVVTKNTAICIYPDFATEIILTPTISNLNYVYDTGNAIKFIQTYSAEVSPGNVYVSYMSSYDSNTEFLLPNAVSNSIQTDIYIKT